MLILRSFLLTDEKGMNDALAQYTLSNKATVFVSNGQIVLQMDDGLPMNRTQKIVMTKEERNSMEATLGPIEHSLRVLDVQIEEISKQIKGLEDDLATPETKKDGNKKAKLTQKLLGLKNTLAQFENQSTANKAEIDRVNVNLNIFDQTISDLIEFRDGFDRS